MLQKRDTFDIIKGTKTMIFLYMRSILSEEKVILSRKGKYDDLSSFNSNWSSSLLYIFIYIFNSIFDCSISSLWSD